MESLSSEATKLLQFKYKAGGTVRWCSVYCAVRWYGCRTGTTCEEKLQVSRSVNLLTEHPVWYIGVPISGPIILSWCVNLIDSETVRPRRLKIGMWPLTKGCSGLRVVDIWINTNSITQANSYFLCKLKIYHYSNLISIFSIGHATFMTLLFHVIYL